MLHEQFFSKLDCIISKFDFSFVKLYIPEQNKNSRRAEWECKFTFWQQVAIMEQQQYSISLVTAVNKTVLRL